MTTNNLLDQVLLDGVEAREVSADIYSVIDSAENSKVYDDNAKNYDRVIGSWLYNKLVWGNAPADYAAFAQRALDSGDGPFLDGGCGSLVFTADVYARSQRPIVLLDYSLGMLNEARKRLIEGARRVPDNVVLVQGDLLKIGEVFRPKSFNTIGNFGIIHLFEDAAQILTNLRALTAGQLYFTSLVAEGGMRRRYMNQLKKMDEFATPRTTAQLREHLAANFLSPSLETKGGMAYGVFS